MADIKGCAKRIWVKALSAGLPEPGGALQSRVVWEGTVGCGGRVDYLFEEHNIYGRAFASPLINGEVEKNVILPTGDESSSSMSAASRNKDGTTVITGPEDCSVQL